MRRGSLLDFFKFFGLAFVTQIVFLILSFFLFLDNNFSGLNYAIAEFYLWPLSLLPQQGGSHGGELFFTPFTAIFYSIIFGILMVYFKRIGTVDK